MIIGNNQLHDINNGKIVDKKKTDRNHHHNGILREMMIEKMRERMQSIQTEALHQMETKITGMVEEILHEMTVFDVNDQDVQQLFLEQTDYSIKAQKNRPSKSSSSSPLKSTTLPEKQFIMCNSLLTDLFEVKHIRTIYNIFIVILLMLLLNTFVHDFVADGSINVGLYPIIAGFGKFDITASIWLSMQISSIGLYVTFRLWAYYFNKLVNFGSNHSYSTYWNIICLFGYIFYQILLIFMTVTYTLRYNLPIASSIMILMELVRFLMKNHAFIRSNVPTVLMGKLKVNDNENKCDNDDNTINKMITTTILLPSFHNYIYFMFAPTLVYRNQYPRTKYIRWQRVLWHYCEVIGVIFYVSFIFERFLIPYFQDFGNTTKSIEPKTLVLSIFGCILPGTIANLCGFYCLLHAWMNASAEMLKFGDRMFYKDWWNATSFDVYYRTWNIVVHDWLYTYVYKDIYENVLNGSKFARTGATLFVFTLSAIFHEFILSFSFRFFYPVLFTLFQGCGCLFMFVRIPGQSTIGNIFVWTALIFGNGLLISLYSMEYFARQNCPINNIDDGDLNWKYFIPISWRCNGLT